MRPQADATPAGASGGPFLRTALRHLARPGRPRPGWVALALLAPLLAALTGLGMTVVAARVKHGDSTYYFGENRAGMYANVALLAVCAVACHLSARRAAAAGDRRAWRFWAFNFALFVLLALDDQFAIHENLDKGFHWLFGLDPLNKVTRHLDDLIVLAYGVALLVVWWRSRPLVLRRPWMVWAMAAGGAQFAVMVLFDLFSLGKAVEETLKMSASASIAAALFEPILNEMRRVPDGPAPASDER